VDDPREHGRRKDPAFYQGVIESKFLNDLAWEINEQSAKQCREWCDRIANQTGRPRFVAGASRAADGFALQLAGCGRCGLSRLHV
jgi:5-methyltetrahydrofolate--homocysteine methyltransferase